MNIKRLREIYADCMGGTSKSQGIRITPTHTPFTPEQEADRQTFLRVQGFLKTEDIVEREVYAGISEDEILHDWYLAPRYLTYCADLKRRKQPERQVKKKNFSYKSQL